MNRALPSALEKYDEIVARAPHGRIAVFLDYDGTLSPIVTRPEHATLEPAMRAAVECLSARATVAIVSGRDREAIQSLVGLPGLYYAGSHGFDIAGPGLAMEQPEGAAARPALAAAADALERTLASIDGAWVERKRFATTVHYRQVAEARHADVRAAAQAEARRQPLLRMTGGKRVYELRPSVDWHKGRAVMFLLDTLDLSRGRALPIYVGDDETDEDAFAVLRDSGIGILCGDATRKTQARYAVPDTDAVRALLERLARG